MEYGTCDNCGASADDCRCGDYINTAPAQGEPKPDKDTPKAYTTEQIAEMDAFWGKDNH